MRTLLACSGLALLTLVGAAEAGNTSSDANSDASSGFHRRVDMLVSDDGRGRYGRERRFRRDDDDDDRSYRRDYRRRYDRYERRRGDDDDDDD